MGSATCSPLSIVQAASPCGRVYNSSTWDDFRQLKAVPEATRELLHGSRFGLDGSPASYSAIPGFDRTSYNGHNPNTSTSVSKVHGVFAGWTASDLVADVQLAAQLTYSIYGDSAAPVNITGIRAIRVSGGSGS